LKLLDKYIIREFIKPFLLSISAFVIIMLSSQLFWMMDLIIIKGIPAITIIKLIIYMIPGVLVDALPLSVLFASILCISRISKDSELIVMRSTGIRFFRLIMPITILGAVISIGTFYINEYLAPMTNYKSQQIIAKVVFEEENPQIKEQIFFNTQDNLYFYINQADMSENTMQDILVYEIRYDKFPRLLTANSGKITGEKWILLDGSINDMNSSGMITTSMSFESLEINMDTSKTQLYFGVQKNSTDMNMKELKRYIEMFKSSGIDATSYEVDYYLKTAMPFAALIFSILGVSMVQYSPRRSGTSVGMIIGALVSLLYYVISAFFGSLGRIGKIDTVFAAWIPNIIFMCIGLFFLSRVDKVNLSIFAKKRRDYKGKSSVIMILMLAMTFLGFLNVPSVSAYAASDNVAVITGEKAIFNGKTEVWTIYGKTNISFGNVCITADQAEFNMNSEFITLVGNVTLNNEDGRFESDSAVFNFYNNELKFNNINASISYEGLDDFLYLEGNSFDISFDTYKLLNGYVTTCELEQPHYRIEAEEIKIIGTQRILLTNFSYYEGNFKLFTIPKFIIPIGGDGLQLPVLGYSYYGGWYINTTYNYSLKDQLNGSLYVDYYGKLGPAFGLNNTLNIGNSGNLQICSYFIFNKNTGNIESQIDLEGSIQLPHDLNLVLDMEYVDYKRHSYNREEELKTSIFLDRSTDSNYFELSYDSILRNYGIHTNLTDVEYSYIGFISDKSTLIADVFYRYYEVNGEKIQNNINYKLNFNKLIDKSKFQIIVQDEVYLDDIDEDENDEDYQEDEYDNKETVPLYKALKRLPEITFSVSNKSILDNIPFVLSGNILYGRYIEDAIRDGNSLTLDGQKAEIDARISANGVKITSDLLFNGTFRTLGSMYSFDEYRYGYGANLNLRLELKKNTFLSLYYDSLFIEGDSLFVFDRINSYNTVGGLMSSYHDILNLSLDVRYNMLQKKFYNSSFNVNFTPDEDFCVGLSGKYDMNSLKPISATVKVDMNIEDIVDFKVNAIYDFNTEKFTKIQSQADIEIGFGVNIWWNGIYNFKYNDFTKAQIGIKKDLHCRNISLMYDHVNKLINLDFKINAFSGADVLFGLDADRAML